jgi:hypothetical protein
MHQVTNSKSCCALACQQPAERWVLAALFLVLFLGKQKNEQSNWPKAQTSILNKSPGSHSPPYKAQNCSPQVEYLLFELYY